MKRRIVCFGDSNTYGFDPRDPIEKRYPPEERWPDLLAASTGWETVNLGLNGRTIPQRKRETELALEQIRKRLPADCLVIMLGSNDALTMESPSAEKVSARMDRFLRELRTAFPELPILLVSPPRVRIPLAHIQEIFDQLIPLYRRVALRYRAAFASAPAWRIPLSADDVHFAPEGHVLFAEKVERQLRQLLDGYPSS